MMTTPLEGSPLSMDDPTGEMESAVRVRRLWAFSGLTVAQLVGLASGFVTAPLLARALGPTGRGLLATVQIPIGLAPYLAQLGLAPFALNLAARRVPLRDIIGSLAPPVLLVAASIAVAAPWLGSALAGQRALILPYLTVGLALLPIAVVTDLVLNCLLGLERWTVLILARVLTPLSLLIPTTVLAALGELTVRSACLITLVSTSVATLCVIPTIAKMGRPRFQGAILSRGLHFGLRAWPGTLASLSNQRLDQLLMIPLLSARQLGLYAVSVTIASLVSLFVGQLTTVLLPRIAAGETRLIAVTVRSTLLVGAITGAGLVLATVTLMTAVFGDSFADSRPLVALLVPAYLMLAGTTSLGQALAAAGRPGVPTVGEFVGLAVTIPGLVVLLPNLQALGAAIVSLAAYGATFATVVVIASRAYGIPMHEFVAPRIQDLHLLWESGPKAALTRLKRHRSPGFEGG